MRATHVIVLATENRHKLQEMREIFLAYPDITLHSAGDFITNIEKLGEVETHDTYLENSIAKARWVNRGCHYPALADDTGLELTALQGRPGVRSHRYAQLPAASSMSQGQANIELLLKELNKSGVEPVQGLWQARFVTHVALALEGMTLYAQGVLEGGVISQHRGTGGFGYDSIFVPQGYSKTLAEMSQAEKNAISHRSRAIHALMQEVKQRGVVLAKP